jgi:hypothetical protein
LPFRQRPILNFAPRGKLWPPRRSCPPRAKLSPTGEVVPHGRRCPLGVKLPPGGEILFSPPFFKTMGSVHPWGWTKGWTFSLGAKFHLGAHWGPGVKLRMALWVTRWVFEIIAQSAAKILSKLDRNLQHRIK